MLVETQFQLGNNRNGGLALRPLRLAYVAPPDGFLNPYFGAVIVFLSEPAYLPLARACERRRGDDRSFTKANRPAQVVIELLHENEFIGVVLAIKALSPMD